MAIARANMTLPEELLREVDELAGPRGRSRYVAEAVAARVKRDKLGRAIEAAAGSLAAAGHAITRDEVSAWVREVREEETR